MQKSRLIWSHVHWFMWYNWWSSLVASHLFYKPHTHALIRNGWCCVCVACYFISRCMCYVKVIPHLGKYTGFSSVEFTGAGAKNRLAGWVLRIVHPLQAQFFCTCSCILYLDYVNIKLVKILQCLHSKEKGVPKRILKVVSISNTFVPNRANTDCIIPMIAYSVNCRKNITGVATTLWVFLSTEKTEVIL